MKLLMKLFVAALLLSLLPVAEISAQGRSGKRQPRTQHTTPRADKVITVKGVSFKMIKVQGGTFTMGAVERPHELSDKEVFLIKTAGDGYDYSMERFELDKPHNVTLSDYYIGETEVTQELWQAVMGNNPSEYAPKKTHPVESVNWEDCQEFIRKLNQLTGRNFRLPTEAEWEYAARGGNKSRGYKYAGSNNPDAVAWYGYLEKSSQSKSLTRGTHPVKKKQANELGIYDMSGNVSEWCQDWFDRYSGDSQTNPQGPSSAPTNLKIPSCKLKTENHWTVYSDYSSQRVVRGGNHWQDPERCRVWDRVSYEPINHISMDLIGLRLVLQ